MSGSWPVTWEATTDLFPGSAQSLCCFSHWISLLSPTRLVSSWASFTTPCADRRFPTPKAGTLSSMLTRISAPWCLTSKTAWMVQRSRHWSRWIWDSRREASREKLELVYGQLLLMRWSNRRWKSFVHRVVEPPNANRGGDEIRYRIPLLASPDPAMVVNAMKISRTKN